ncbi:MAG: O-antigen ligase family protein [Caldilineaceae bacterium]|nr:O-antigen ligase family protein [Caldilineaceae bacterium]
MTSRSHHRSHKKTIWTRLAWFEPFWLLFMAPSILLPGRFWEAWLQPYLVMALFLFWPIRRLAYRQVSVATPLNGWIAMLAAWLPITLWISILPEQSWVAVGYLGLGIAAFFALINWPTARQRPYLLAWLLLAIGFGLSLLGPALMDISAGSRMFRIPQLDARLGLLSAALGEAVNPNVFAGALVLISPFGAALALEPRWTRQWIWPLGAGLLSLFALLSLVITQSRGAYVAVIIGLLVLVVLRWRRLVWALPFVIIGVGVFAYRLGPAAILDQLSSDTSLAGLSGRMEIWTRAGWAIQDFSLTGVGHGLFNPVVSTLYPFFVLPTDIPHAHNLLLQVGVDMGLVGVTAYLGLILTVFYIVGKTLRRAAQHRQQAEDRAQAERHVLTWTLAAGVTAAMTSMLVHGLVDAVTWGTKLTFIPWLFYTLAALLYLGPRRRIRKRRRSRAERGIDDSEMNALMIADVHEVPMVETAE